MKVLVRMKRCTGCQKVKPWSDYYADTKWPDGTMRRPQARCKSCALVYNRDRRRRARANGTEPHRDLKRDYARLRANPIRLAAKQDRDRERLRRLYCIPPERYRFPRRPEHGGPRIPAEPFAAWLRSLGDSYADIARVTHLPDRSVWRILNEQKRVELDTVDRALLAVGDGTSLSDLYSTQELAA